MFTPTSNIRLLKDVDICADYTNTFSFPSVSAQTAFFQAKTERNFLNVTYIRKNNAVRVSGNAETLFNCNYLMFQNSNFGDKWFYAFITDIVYVSDNVTEIVFEIDVLQTWYFDLIIKDCFIEREHVADDAIGKNVIEEDIANGEYISNSISEITDTQDLKIIIASTIYSNGNRVAGSVTGNIYNSVVYYVCDDADNANAFISAPALIAKPEAILYICMVPASFIDPLTLVTDFETAFKYIAPGVVGVNLTKTVNKNNTTIDGYTPKNNKLFCYPYNYLNVTNYNNAVIDLHYELFTDETITFNLKMNLGANPTVYLIPTNYKGITANYLEALTITDFPFCGWTSDVYKTWLTQNRVSNIVNVAGSVLSVVAASATGNPIGVASGVLGVGQAIGNFDKEKMQAPQSRGNQSASSLVGVGKQVFSLNQKSIRYKQAQIIDNYFSMYGYKVNELKTPNFRSRTNWNYLKCITTNIYGDIPQKDLVKINNIFKTGLTFWHNDDVGNYARTNPIR